jgi:ribonuclease P protein component
VRQTLPKSIILRGYQSFTKVITGGISFQGTLLTGFVLTDASDPNIEIGFSVPKKRVPLAADRNRIRRLMRESVRKHRDGFFASIREKRVGALIVVMYKGEKHLQVKRLMLHDVEPAWLSIQQQILKAL